MTAPDKTKVVYSSLKGGLLAAPFYETSTDNLTALAGGGQAGATLLTGQTSRVATVATVGDSVQLPPSQPGLEILVINHGANAMQVFGNSSTTDTIDDQAASAGVQQMAGSMCIYCCSTVGAWYTNGIGTGYAGSFPTQSYTNGIVAHAGGGQASGTAITTVINRVTTVATAADSCTLPAAKPGMSIYIANAAAANSMNLFPATGEAINALGANAAFAIAANKTAQLICAVAGQWHAILSA